MRKLLPLTFILLFFLALWSGCADRKGNAVGVDFIQRDDFGEETTAVFYPAATDTFYQAPVQSGESQYLLLGESAGRSFRLFFSISPSAIPENSTIDSAWVCLFISTVFGDTLELSLPKAYEVNSTWDESEITWESVESEALLGQELAIEPRKVNTDTLCFYMPNDFIQTWLDDSTNADKGFALAYDQNQVSNLILKLPSTQNEYITTYSYLKLFVTSKETSEQDEVTIRYEQDAYVAHYDIAPDDQLLWVQSGIGVKTFLQFDLSSIPEPATINKALLTLQQDTLLAWPSMDDDFMIKVQRLNEPFQPGITLDVDTDDPNYASTDSDTLAINLTSLFQDWATQTYENYGMIITTNSEYSDWNGRAFYSTRADSALMPVLKIFYSLPPTTLTTASDKSL